MSGWSVWLAIASGGAIGALLRGLIFHGIEKASSGGIDGFWAKQGSARSTLIVNVLGSLFLGVLIGGQAGSAAEWSEPHGSSGRQVSAEHSRHSEHSARMLSGLRGPTSEFGAAASWPHI
jgi:hypothetical protein